MSIITDFRCILLGLGFLIAPLPAKAEAIFEEVRTQYIAALADPQATSGDGAQTWGLWETDPGPRGVWLSFYPLLKAAGGYTPARWKFDSEDWWLDENGLLMEKPKFPLPPGKYIVTGGREVTSVLTVFPKDENGNQRWELSKDATIYDVTHLECRSARYKPASDVTPCSPANVNDEVFRIAPGEAMPSVDGCNKQDYTVLIVVAKAVEN